jgi:K+-sensing histidine kinase KdpD
MSGVKSVEGIDLPSIFREAGELVLQECGDLHFSVHAPPELPTLTGDPGKLAQMARFFFEESRATLKRRGEIEVRFGTCNDGRSIETSFIDNGDPVPEAELSRLFDPFYVRATNPEELGTNLMACYLTVFHHGGTIRAERTADGRNAIVFTLPIAPVQEEEEGVEPSPRLLWRLADFSQRDRRSGSAALTS